MLPLYMMGMGQSGSNIPWLLKEIDLIVSRLSLLENLLHQKQELLLQTTPLLAEITAALAYLFSKQRPPPKIEPALISMEKVLISL